MPLLHRFSCKTRIGAADPPAAGASAPGGASTASAPAAVDGAEGEAQAVRVPTRQPRTAAHKPWYRLLTMAGRRPTRAVRKPDLLEAQPPRFEHARRGPTLPPCNPSSGQSLDRQGVRRASGPMHGMHLAVARVMPRWWRGSARPTEDGFRQQDAAAASTASVGAVDRL